MILSLLVCCLLLSLAGRPSRWSGRLGLRLKSTGAAARHLPVPVLAGTPIQAKPVKLPDLTGAPRKIIQLRVKGKTLVFSIDRSGSMYPLRSGDAGNRCGAAALSLVNLQRDSGGGCCWVLHWGSTVPNELISGPLDVRARKAVKKALAMPPSLGGTDLVLALRRTCEVTRPEPDDDRFIFYFLSDGITGVSDATRSAVAAFPPGSVHMVLVDHSNGCSPAMEAELRSAGFASVTRLKTFDTWEMAHQLGEIFAESIDLELAQPTNSKRKAA